MGKIKRSERAKKKKEDKTQRDPDATESDSDFEEMKLGKSVSATEGERQYLDEFVTLGELGGRIPPSLMINVNFEKFA